MENWKTYKLGDLTSVITKGTTPSTYGYNFENTGINYIKAESLNYDGMVDVNAFVHISSDAHEKLKRSQLQVNDILFSMAGIYLGKVGMVKESFCPANTNQAVGIIRINNSLVHPKFVEYALRNPSTVTYVNSQSGQSAQPNINLAEIGNLTFLYPPIEEQRAIASILSAIDDKIELNLQMNKTLEEMAMTLYKHWFVDFGPFQEGEFVESELGMIPMGWEVATFDSMLVLQRGFDLPEINRVKGDYPVFAASGRSTYHCEKKVNGPGITTGRSGVLGKVFFINEDFWPLNTTLWVKEYPNSSPYHAYFLLSTLNLKEFNSGSAVPTLNSVCL